MKVSKTEIVLTIAMHCSLLFVTIKLMALAISAVAAAIMGWLQ